MIALHDDNPTRRPPVVTIALVVANVVVFLFWQPHGGSRAATSPGSPVTVRTTSSSPGPARGAGAAPADIQLLAPTSWW